MGRMKNFFGKIKQFCVKNPIGVVLISLCVITLLVATILMATLIPHSDLTKIEIETAPQKTQYVDGENVDTTGMVVKAYYGKKSKTVTNYTLDKTYLSLGDTSVKVSYADGGAVKSATFSVSVVEKSVTSIEITQLPTKLDYIEHSYFDPTGMVVTAYYNNGNSQIIDNWQHDKKDKLQLDDTTVTVSYGGKTTEIHITIKAKILQAIYFKSLPQKLAYLSGEYFDFLGVQVYAKYDNADDELIKEWDYDKKELLTVADGEVEFSFSLHGVVKTAIVKISVEKAPEIDADQQLAQSVLDILPPIDSMNVENLPSIEYALTLLDKLTQPTPEQLAVKQLLESKRDEIIKNLPVEEDKTFNITYKVGGGLDFADIDFAKNPIKYTKTDGAVTLSEAVSLIAVEQGYFFNGWLLDGQVVTELKDIKSDVTVFADFKLTPTVNIKYIDIDGGAVLFEQSGIDRAGSYDLENAGLDTSIYSACGELPIAFFAQDKSRIYSIDLSKGKTIAVLVATAQARQLHMDGSKGASVSWIYKFNIDGVESQTSQMPQVGNMFVIPVGAAVKIVSMNANIDDIIVDGVSKGSNFNNTVVQAEFDMQAGEYAVSVTFNTKLKDITTLSFLGYNQHSIVYPAGWNGIISEIDLKTVKFIYDEDNENYVTEYNIDGEIYYIDELAKYRFDGDTQIYVKRVRNDFSLLVIYANGQERLDELKGKQSLQSALNSLPDEATVELNKIFADDRLYLDAQKSQKISAELLLNKLLRNDTVIYSDWEKKDDSSLPSFDEVDYGDCDFVNTWSALFSNGADLLASQLVLTADGYYTYNTFVNGANSANINGVYRIENGKITIKTLNLDYPYLLVDKDDLNINMDFAADGLLSVTFINLSDTNVTVFEHTMTCGNVRPVNYTGRDFTGTHSFNNASIELRDNGTAKITNQGNSIEVVYRVTDDGKFYIFDNTVIGTGEIKGILEAN